MRMFMIQLPLTRSYKLGFVHSTQVSPLKHDILKIWIFPEVAQFAALKHNAKKVRLFIDVAQVSART